jgi:hypothetical protein
VAVTRRPSHRLIARRLELERELALRHRSTGDALRAELAAVRAELERVERRPLVFVPAPAPRA